LWSGAVRREPFRVRGVSKKASTTAGRRPGWWPASVRLRARVLDPLATLLLCR